MVDACWLDEDVEQAARWLVDEHVLSSILEGAMVLTTALQANGYPRSEEPYVTHEDRPFTVWAGEHLDNWRRLYAYVEACHEEWRYRWDNGDRVHACWQVVEGLELDRLVELDWSGEASPPPQLTGEWEAEDVVEAYRLYDATTNATCSRGRGGRRRRGYRITDDRGATGGRWRRNARSSILMATSYRAKG